MKLKLDIPAAFLILIVALAAAAGLANAISGKNNTMTTKCEGDPCPHCQTKLDYDRGHDHTREEPAEPPTCFCMNCGEVFDVDHDRQMKRHQAQAAANEIGLRVERDGVDRSAIEETIFKLLDGK